jgi:hypothetical protein
MLAHLAKGTCTVPSLVSQKYQRATRGITGEDKLSLLFELEDYQLATLDRWNITIDTFVWIDKNTVIEIDRFAFAVEEFFDNFFDKEDAPFVTTGNENAGYDGYFEHWIRVTGLDRIEAFVLMITPACEDFTARDIEPLIRKMSFNELTAQVYAKIPLDVIKKAVDNDVDGEILRSLIKGVTI